MPSLSIIVCSIEFELSEEDREDAVESELPCLPPDKDPQAQTLTRPQPKKMAHNKEMVRRDPSVLASQYFELSLVHGMTLSFCHLCAWSIYICCTSHIIILNWCTLDGCMARLHYTE